jgi:hypothetical protein
VTVNHGDGDGPLRRLLKDTAAEHGLSMTALTVLASQNDPFRMDTPAGHRVGAWLAMHVERLFPEDKPFHLRGLHYALMTDKTKKPNGEPYRNIDPDWQWLQDVAADAARWLGYIPFDRIIHKRNAVPVIRRHLPSSPHPYVEAGFDLNVPELEDITPRMDITQFDGVQPYKLVLFGEKSSLEDVLDPIAERFQADLYLMTGEISDTYLHRMAKIGADDGRPMVVFTFSDCDPSGWQMPVSIGRKLQALKAMLFPDLDFRVYRVALTHEQVGAYDLPSTPLKKKDKRAEKWREAWGIEQTEIDALATLQPDRLRQIATDAIAPFYDRTLEGRVWQAYAAWIEEAQAALEQHLGHGELARIQGDAAARLDTIRAEVEAINDVMGGVTLAGVDLPDVEVPEAETDGDHGTPLVDSEWDFADQCQALIESKAYTTGDQEDQP